MVKVEGKLPRGAIFPLFFNPKVYTTKHHINRQSITKEGVDANNARSNQRKGSRYFDQGSQTNSTFACNGDAGIFKDGSGANVQAR
jgi:hypothetical protein